MPSLHAVWCGNQYSVLCFAYCCAALQHWHTTRSRLSECKRQLYASATVQTCQCGCELAGGEETLPRPIALYVLQVYNGIVHSCSTVTLHSQHYWWISTYCTINQQSLHLHLSPYYMLFCSISKLYRMILIHPHTHTHMHTRTHANINTHTHILYQPKRLLFLSNFFLARQHGDDPKTPDRWNHVRPRHHSCFCNAPIISLRVCGI